ncbi:hypothetical protein LF817_11330 [Halobacillus sp. A1]|uniref:hypothetical protein n=1 Tax=Halobacillus sp. A1 TaxID=2880262 RepID=UPI0020A695DB|nr:hypothetical protein [Halobacillus sp. A1]MCP3031937.1 hypothetical protein [Halobacillus sp. A1]
MNPDLCELLANAGFVRCYLTNAAGSPVDEITCEEQGNREDVSLQLPDGEPVTLQKITIGKQGYVVVEVGDEDTLCVSDPIPFCFNEHVILCAPAGTDVVCSVTDFDCQASVNCLDETFESLDIHFTVCQSIQTVAEAVIEQEVAFCVERDVIIPDRCSFTMPAQCPVIFPSEMTDLEVTSKRTSEKEYVTSPTSTQLQEVACLSVTRVYDWIVQQSDFQRTIPAGNVEFSCSPCDIHVFVPAVIICDRFLSGKVICGDIDPIEGAEVTFRAEPAIVDFTPDSVITDEFGNFEVETSLPAVTEPTDVVITAETTVNGQEVSTSLPTIIQCLADPCIIELFAEEEIVCDGFVDGRVRCDGRVIEGAVVTLESDDPAVTFNPNPVITGSHGNYFSGVTVADGTPSSTVIITASTTVEGQMISDSVEVQVECDSPCP